MCAKKNTLLGIYFKTFYGVGVVSSKPVNLTHILAYLNLIGYQAAVSGHSNGELVVPTGRLTGHEVQLKQTTTGGKEQRNNEVEVLYGTTLTLPLQEM